MGGNIGLLSLLLVMGRGGVIMLADAVVFRAKGLAHPVFLRKLRNSGIRHHRFFHAAPLRHVSYCTPFGRLVCAPVLLL